MSSFTVKSIKGHNSVKTESWAMALFLCTSPDNVLYLCKLSRSHIKRFKRYGAATVGCFGFNGLLRQYFSLYLAVSRQREMIDERKK